MVSFRVMTPRFLVLFFFFFNDTATTEIYTLSLHDALPISPELCELVEPVLTKKRAQPRHARILSHLEHRPDRSEEHTSELQSLAYLVCRLLLEKKKLPPRPGPLCRSCPQAPVYPTTATGST